MNALQASSNQQGTLLTSVFGILDGLEKRSISCMRVHTCPRRHLTPWSRTSAKRVRTARIQTRLDATAPWVHTALQCCSTVQRTLAWTGSARALDKYTQTQVPSLYCFPYLDRNDVSILVCHHHFTDVAQRLWHASLNECADIVLLQPS